MRSNWLLLKKAGRQSYVRLLLTAVAIALGVALLCYFVAGINGLLGRSQRTIIQNTALAAAYHQPQQPVSSGAVPLNVSLAGSSAQSAWRDQKIKVMSLQASVHSPSFAGLKTPAPGEYYLSPALAALVADHPNERIGERYGTLYKGLIPNAYVDSPDSLLVIRGASPQEVTQAATAKRSFVPVYQTTTERGTGFDSLSLVMLGIGGTILLFPIISFVAVATQLGARQREKRYAALRLIGATKRQVTQLLLMEALVASLIGIVLGITVFLLVQQPLVAFRFGELRFWPADLVLETWQYAAISGLVLVLVGYINHRRMRRARISPLGVAQLIERPKPLRAWRLIPLVIGIGIFGWISLEPGRDWVLEQANESPVPLLIIVGGVICIMYGLVSAGGWLTNRIARFWARHTRHGVTLIAAKRTAVHSQTVFRSVSGVVLSLFAGGFYLTAVSGIGAVYAKLAHEHSHSHLRPNTALISGATLSSEAWQQLARQPYVQSGAAIMSEKDVLTLRCHELRRYTDHDCPAGTAEDGFVRMDLTQSVDTQPVAVQPPTTASPTSYVVALDQEASIDQLRSFVAGQSGQAAYATLLLGEYAKRPRLNPIMKNFAELTYVGMAVTLAVAIASLIVSTLGGLLERRRSLFTLRLGGMHLGQLRRLVLVESLIPLVSVSLLAASIGTWTGAVFVSTFSSTLKPVVTVGYIAVLATAIVLAAIGIYAILPVLRRLTSPEANQTE